MFSKEELKEKNTTFWNAFKAISKKHQSSEGRRINWVNYPTHVKPLYIRLHADQNTARFSIEIQDKDEGIRNLICEQFTELKKVLEAEMPRKGNWIENAENSAHQEIGRIYWEINGVNMYTLKDHKKIFNFLMEHLLGFDRFYAVYKEIVIGLIR